MQKTSEPSQEEWQSSNLEKIKVVSNHLVDPEIAVAIFEFLPDALIVVDSFGKIKLINKRTEEMFGYTREELLGVHAEVLLPDDLKPKVLYDFQMFMAEDPFINPKGLRPPFELWNKNKERFLVRIHINPIKTAEGILVAALIRQAE